VFRIFNEIAQYEFDLDMEPGSSKIDYMIDQSHNLKPKLEAMVQTVCEAQKLFAKAHLVDREALAIMQAMGDITGAEMILKDAFETDVTELLTGWRESKGVPPKPLEALRESGVIERLGMERSAGKRASAGGYA
jgi:L-rhamnose isomerase/sugar isomerase